MDMVSDVIELGGTEGGGFEKGWTDDGWWWSIGFSQLAPLHANPLPSLG